MYPRQKQSLLHTAKRYQTLRTNKITVLPILIMMPHSACNCRCVMCDIWKGNKNLKQLEEKDIQNILISLKKLETKRIFMSGGEALLNKNFFRFCELIKKQNIKITLLSTGLTVSNNAEKIIEFVDDVIVSLDGNEKVHNEIRNIKGAFEELLHGVKKLKSLRHNFPVSARTVIHQLNFRIWDEIISAAKNLKLDSISFLPADVSSEAFNRKDLWNDTRQNSVLVGKDELPVLKEKTEQIISEFKSNFEKKFIAESPDKIRKIYQYYAAHQGLADFPEKKCNAPWVSAVVEADGTVRPCFFHDSMGSIKNNDLDSIINNPESLSYLRNLDITKNETCKKCVCYLNLSPRNRYY